MKKQHLKRFAYGVSALTLGLSAVSIFPVGAYAEPVEVESAGLVDEGPAEGMVGTDDGSVDGGLVDNNSINDGLADGDPNAGDMVLNMTNSLDGDGDESSNRSNVSRVKNNYERVQKVVNKEEPFTVQAVKKASITVVDMSDSYYLMADVGDGESGGTKFATEDQITVVETAPGEYTVTPLQAGRFMITLQAFVMTEDGLINNQLDINLTVVATVTDAAKTITNIMNDYAEANTVADNAYREFLAVYRDENATEEQKAAAEAECQRKIEAAYNGVDQREINAFGDDSMAIWEAAETGKELTTKVAVGVLAESEVDEKVKSALLDKLDITFSGNINYYNVDVEVYANGEKIGTLKELTGKQTVVIDGFTDAAAGYKRVFKVLAYHIYYDKEGAAHTEVIEIDDVEFDEATGSITFPADKFSTYLVAYKDVFAPSVNTGAATSVEGGSATASMSLSVVAVAVVATLAGAVKFAKLRK